MTRPPKAIATVLLCGATWLMPGLSLAEDTAPTHKPQVAEAGSPPLAVPPEGEPALIAKLRSPTESEAVAAARKLVEMKTPTVQAALYDALALGVPPKVAAAVLAALSAQRSPDSLPVLELYTHHRNPDLRKRATQGLAALVVAPEENEAPKPPVAGKRPPK